MRAMGSYLQLSAETGYPWASRGAAASSHRQRQRRSCPHPLRRCPKRTPSQLTRQVAAHSSVAIDLESQIPAASNECCNRLSEGGEQEGGGHQPPPAAAAELSAPAGQVSSGDPRQAPCQLTARSEVAVDQELHPPA